MRKCIFCALLLLVSLAAYPQKSKAKLEKEIASLQEEIATANKLLKKTSKDKETNLNQVAILDKKIKQREALIKAYNEQIAVLETEINEGQGHIKTLNGDLKNMRKEYAKMIVFANKNRSHYDRLGFLFSSEDFNQAFSRLRYIRQFSDARKTKMDQIAATEKRISEEVEARQKAKEQQAAMLQDEKQQQAAMQGEKKDLNQQIASLKKQEGKIQQDIKTKKQEAQKLKKAVDDIIAEEIRKANELARKEAEAKAKKGTTSKPSPSQGMALTPEEKSLSDSFAANKGKLPWPVEKGIVTSGYGRHESPVSNKVIVTNTGIDIAAEENSQARAVFGGSVVCVNKLMASNSVIIINHGAYFSVYSNIEKPAVKRGDRVKIKQNLGLIHTNKVENKTELHFEILKEKERMNPEAWLAR